MAALLCRRCGGPTTTAVTSTSGTHLVRCERCRTVQLDLASAPLEPDFYEYYADREHLPVEELHLPLTTERLRQVIRQLAAGAPGGRLLDVGCGEGQLVAAAGAEGWAATGIDLSAAAVRICRRIGLDCSTTDLFGDDLEPGVYDAVTMIEFIEHVDAPGEVLARVEQLLAPGGVAYLTTPNYGSLGRRVLGGEWGPVSPAHLWYFTPRTLASLVRSATGLSVESVQTKNLSAAAIRRLVPRWARLGAAGGGPGSHVGEGFAAEQELRHRIEGSPALRTGKSLANRALALTGAGETIAAVVRRGPSRAGR